MRKKSFLMLALTLVTSLVMLTSCGSDDPEPTPKPTSGYFTYYLLTTGQTLSAMQITATLKTQSEDKSGEVTASKCVHLDGVADPQARETLKRHTKNFTDQSDIIVYQVKFATETRSNVSLTYGLTFTAKALEDSAADPDLGYGTLVTFTPNTGSTNFFSGTFQYSQGVHKDNLTIYANLQNAYNQPRTQRIILAEE